MVRAPGKTVKGLKKGQGHWFWRGMGNREAGRRDETGTALSKKKQRPAGMLRRGAAGLGLVYGFCTTWMEVITGWSSGRMVPLSSTARGATFSQMASTTSMPSVTWPKPA